MNRQGSIPGSKSHLAAAWASFKSLSTNKRIYPRDLQIPHRGSVWIVQVLSINKRIYPRVFKSHIAAACGSFRPFLPTSASIPEIFKSHIAAAWGSFKSFLRREATFEIAKSHIAAACGSFKSFLRREATFEITKSHIAAAWGSFRPFLPAGHSPLGSQNPTSRQRVDWFKSSLKSRPPRSQGWCRVGKEDLNDPHAAAMWDSCAYGVVLANVERT